MKKIIVPIVAGLTATMLCTGCLDLHVGGGTTNRSQTPTLGQQLIDLQTAKDKGIITDAEYQAQKAKLLSAK